MKKVFFVLFCLAVVIACSKINQQEDPIVNITEPSVTVGVDKITSISAELKGKANLEQTTSSDLVIGFQYSTSEGILPSNSTTIEVNNPDKNYNYSSVIKGLTPETPYYYRSFVHQNGQYTYGETKSFTTKDIKSLIETAEITDLQANSATIHAKLDLTDIVYDEINYDFEVGVYNLGGIQPPSRGFNELKENTFSCSLTGLFAKWKYSYRAFVVLDGKKYYGETIEFETLENTFIDCDAIDLGLSVKWANINLGATKPEEYGAYFSWAETSNKDEYSISNYRYWNGAVGKLTRYCPINKTDHWDGGDIPDGKTELKDYDYVDDAARVILKKNWRIPTYDEVMELKNECDWTWKTINGINGYEIKSKKNGNSIFLPAAGGRQDDDGLIRYYGVNSSGVYWSSSVYVDYPSGAWSWGGSSSGFSSGWTYRYVGSSIRPVTE